MPQHSQVPVPDVGPLSSALPAPLPLLMGAGPVPIPRPVAVANAMVINHLGPVMDRVVDGVKRLAGYAFQTRSDKILGLAGPGSAAMEMAMANVCWPGRRVLCVNSGVFGARFGEMAAAMGADVEFLHGTAGHPVSADAVREALNRRRFDVVTMAHGETSCGSRLVEIAEICRLAKEHGALTVVDAVVTLSAMPVPVDEWGIDVCLTAGQKALSSIPGVSLCVFSDAAWQAVVAHPGPRPHWCYDATRAHRFWGEHQYHYTAPVSGVMALYEALRLVAEETLPKRFQRHDASSQAFQAGVQTMGLELFMPAEVRLNSVVAIRIPNGADGARVRRRMSEVYHVEISGAFGLDILRVGQMGEQCRPEHVSRTLRALGESFQHEGVALDVAAGIAALDRRLPASA